VAPQGENDAKYFGVKMLDEVAMTVQDRAYTSTGFAIQRHR
jgi:hypothetical protein